MAEPTTKNRLKSYVYLKMEYQNQMERLIRLDNDTQLLAMVESDGSQRSLLKSSRMENAAIRKMSQEAKINSRMQEIVTEMTVIEDAIDALIDPLQSEVLRLRYIDCENCRHTKWNDVAIRIYGSDDDKFVMAVWRIHGHALQELQKMGV